jgi:hypothetical protein
MNRLQVIATLIHPCPPPDVMCGFDMCPCGIGCTWPCPTTQAAWIARGLNPDAEISRLMAEAIASVTT